MNIRDAIPTIEDCKLLMTRTNTSLHASMKKSFNKVIHLFATNDDVNCPNKCLIRGLICPIATSIATSVRSNSSMEGDEEGLEIELLTTIGARVMLTKNLLIKIDSRLCQAFPENATIPFGGRSIILVGDLGQLPPVMDKPVYASEGIAKELWNTFTTVVTLDIVFR